MNRKSNCTFSPTLPFCSNKVFLFFFIFEYFSKCKHFSEDFLLAVVNCSVKSPPVRGNHVFKEFLQYRQQRFFLLGNRVLFIQSAFFAKKDCVFS